MSPERLQQIEELYHAARERTSEERAALLAQADPELRREVESLLAQPDNGRFWDRPALDNATELGDAADTLLTAGTCLGPYRIEGKIGEGGMGAVYRAMDTKLGREVALKFLSPWLARDADYLARFEREAKVLASLNHPNIAIVHGLEESNGTRALVMELVEGHTLAARIKEGPIPLKEALRVAEAIAEGLEAANERGIVHRDLKPGNVKINPEGGVKVLDFGLAKISGTPSGPAQDPSALTGETEPGTILGTVGYMSPEQASGKPVDKRADIWAFGVVLWEMLTGKRLFAGEAVSHTLAKVLAAPIDFDKLPKETPPAIRNLVRRCLERDAKNRLSDIGEARIALQTSLVDSSGGAEISAPAKNPRKELWIVAGALALLAGIANWALWPKATLPAPETRFQIPLPEGVTSTPHVLVSPDGRKLLINTLGVQGLWIRDLDALEWRHLPDTFGARAPFWSPDSKFVAFGVANQLKKIDISGGSPQILCTVQNTVASGAWNREGKIVFGSAGNGPLYLVSDAGGVATELTAVDSSHGETFHTSPALLPDGKRFLYFRQGPAEARGIYAGSLDAKPGRQPRKPILLSLSAASYAGGHLFFMRDNTLMAQPFNSSQLVSKGEPVLVADYVDTSGVDGVFSASSGGVLAYRGLGRPSQFQFTWFDRKGDSLGAFGEPSPEWGLVLSPDGARAAVRDSDGIHPGDLWTIDLGRGMRTRLTFRQGVIRPIVWSSDGTRFIFAAETSTSGITDALYEKASSGAGEEKVLFRRAGANIVPTSWSRDGRFLLYHTTPGRDNLWVLPLEGDHQPVQLLAENFNQRSGSFSPDGRWIAY